MTRENAVKIATEKLKSVGIGASMADGNVST